MQIIKLFFFSLLISFAAIAQTYEITFDTVSASGWYGGDDRPGFQRNVADAQSITIEQAIKLESYSVRFISQFDYAQNPSGVGHEVTLRLRIRDSLGVVLHAQDLVLPDTFSGGWATWEEINYNIDQTGKYIFSHHLVGGYDSLQVYSGIACDFNAGYAGGERFVKYVVNDSDAVSWSDWSSNAWDGNFILIGSLLPTSTNVESRTLKDFILEQNYPNPFNPSTSIKYQVSIISQVTLKVYDVLGKEVATLVNEEKPAGIYEVEFNPSTSIKNLSAGRQGLASGVYFYRISIHPEELNAGIFTSTKKMQLIK